MGIKYLSIVLCDVQNGMVEPQLTATGTGNICESSQWVLPA